MTTKQQTKPPPHEHHMFARLRVRVCESGSVSEIVCKYVCVQLSALCCTSLLPDGDPVTPPGFGHQHRGVLLRWEGQGRERLDSQNRDTRGRGRGAARLRPLALCFPPLIQNGLNGTEGNASVKRICLFPTNALFPESTICY